MDISEETAMLLRNEVATLGKYVKDMERVLNHCITAAAVVNSGVLDIPQLGDGEIWKRAADYYNRTGLIGPPEQVEAKGWRHILIKWLYGHSKVAELEKAIVLALSQKNDFAAERVALLKKIEGLRAVNSELRMELGENQTAEWFEKGDTIKVDPPSDGEAGKR